MGKKKFNIQSGREGLTQELNTHAHVPKRVVNSMAEHLKSVSATLFVMERSAFHDHLAKWVTAQKADKLTDDMT